MIKNNIITFAIIFVFLNSCTQTNKIIHNKIFFNNEGFKVDSAFKINKSDKIYINIIDEVDNNLEITPAIDVIDKTFKRYLPYSVTTKNPLSVKNSFILAKNNHSKFILEASISGWNNNHTFLTGVPNTLTIDINIYDIITGKILDRFKLNSTSGFFTYYNDGPLNLVESNIEELISKIIIQ